MTRNIFPAVLAVSMFCSPPAAAQDSEVDAICSQVGRLANLIMQQRQLEVPMSEMMAGRSDGLSRYLVIEAYSRGSYGTPSVRQREIDMFANDMMVMCYLEHDELSD